MSLYDAVRQLPLAIDGYDLEGHAYVISPEFTRKTTEIRLVGAGEEGFGEDVTYDGDEQGAQQARGPVLPLAGEWTIDGFSRHLDTLPLFEGRVARRRGHPWPSPARPAASTCAWNSGRLPAATSPGPAPGRAG